jgi:hypothetical protein
MCTRGLVRIDHREDRIGKQRRSAGGFQQRERCYQGTASDRCGACAMKLRRFLSMDANMLFSEST